MLAESKTRRCRHTNRQYLLPELHPLPQSLPQICASSRGCRARGTHHQSAQGQGALRVLQRNFLHVSVSMHLLASWCTCRDVTKISRMFELNLQEECAVGTTRLAATTRAVTYAAPCRTRYPRTYPWVDGRRWSARRLRFLFTSPEQRPIA